MFLQTLYKVANRLDELGHYDMANEIDAIIKHFAMDKWTLHRPNSVEKAISRLPDNMKGRMYNLISDLENFGPFVGGKKWRNFGKMKDRASTYHCHIGGGHPTYVAFWRTISNLDKQMEMIFVGTHEEANKKIY